MKSITVKFDGLSVIEMQGLCLPATGKGFGINLEIANIKKEFSFNLQDNCADRVTVHEICLLQGKEYDLITPF